MATATTPKYDLLIHKGIVADWYLKPAQFSLYDKIVELKKKKIKKIVINTHRRFGKSSVVFNYIFEQCFENKNLVARVGGVTEGTIKEIFLSIRNDIFQYAPRMKPEYNLKEGCFYIAATNSGIHLFGNANQAEADKSRGSKANIIYLDEFGFYRFDPNYYLKSVLSPQLDTTNGILIITSTVPRDLSHPFLEQIAEAEAGGYYFRWTIEDSLRTGHVTQDQHEQIISRCGGIDSDEYRREYMCELIPDSKHLIVPEAQDESLYVVERQRPNYYTPYVSIDLGLHDFSINLMGYHDFDYGILYIEAEHKANYTTTGDKVKEWKKLEADLNWNEDGKPLKPKRYSDNDAQQIFDMTNDHQYQVNPISKRVTGDNAQDRISFAESVINKLRIGLKIGKVKIHPRCKFLITTLKYGLWNERRTDFERSDTLGHFDAGICLAYLYDNVDWGRNPYPALPKNVRPSTHYIDYNKINKRDKSIKLLLGRKP
jgi:hypothetical protein